MSCCGGKRRETVARDTFVTKIASVPSPPVAEAASVLFEYTGPTALRVSGPVTHRSYRFAGPGARVAVDRRDAPGIRAVPHLVLVKYQTPFG